MCDHGGDVGLVTISNVQLEGFRRSYTAETDRTPRDKFSGIFFEEGEPE